MSAANPGYGTIAFAKQKIYHSPSCDTFLSNSESQGHCEGIYLELDNIRLICIYRSPKCPIQLMIQTLHNVVFNRKTIPLPPTAVFGDFNFNLLNNDQNELTRFFSHIGFVKHICQDFTTRGRTQIDNIFSNLTNATAGVSESFFSYHRPIWLRFPST